MDRALLEELVRREDEFDFGNIEVLVEHLNGEILLWWAVKCETGLR